MTDKEKKVLAEKIRSEYVSEEKGVSTIDKLVDLNKKVKKLPTIIALIIGIVGALIAGFGMSLIMTDLSDSLSITNANTIGIIIGILGLAFCCGNYPLYKAILSDRKEKYAPEIIRLSDELLK